MTPISSSTTIKAKVEKNPFPDAKHSYQGRKPVVLLILDGWGLGKAYEGNAISLANPLNFDHYWQTYPHTTLEASGELVGLPPNVDGNSETGHLNIGAGHIVYQGLPRINTAIADGSFEQNQALLHAINHAKTNQSTLHLMGLIGQNFVHSSLEHLYALLNLAKKQGLNKVYIHAFTDGRDSPPTSGIHYLRNVMEKCQQIGIGELATVMGRYLAMDRDKRWERIEKAYNSMTVSTGACTKDALAFLNEQYKHNVTDEFMDPINICNPDGSPRLVNDHDAVIFFNFRVDRPRELTKAFVLPDFEAGLKREGYDPFYEKYHKTSLEQITSSTTFHRQKIIKDLYFTTMTSYDDDLPVDVAFPKVMVPNSLGQVLAQQGVNQLRITETEKERFVTYYFNGQQEVIYPGEDRIIFPSYRVRSYEEVPQMRAHEIADKIVKKVQKDQYDFIVCNISNPDMLGHTGNLQAAIKACEITDQAMKKIVDAVLEKNGLTIITADHGNVEDMINQETGQVDTEHSHSPVPFILIGNEYTDKPYELPTGILADIAPTILKLMGLQKPDTMTARELI